MRIAFVDNLPVGGGLSRFSYLLCKNLVKVYPSLQIDYFAHRLNLERTPELKSISVKNVQVKVLESSLLPTSIGKRIIKKLKSFNQSQSEIMELELEKKIKGYDLAYFPSAHMIRKPNLSVPVTGTIHDFNWKYFFGQQIFPSSFVEEMDASAIEWMSSCSTACSSHDVVSEAKKLYPGLSQYPEVVHLAPVVFSTNLKNEEADKILADLNINYPYIIFPGNFYPHKNHLNLFAAFYLLKQRKEYQDLKLILTGMHTDQIKFGIAERAGVQVLTKNSPNKHFDIHGLGYQPNQVIESLIKKARLLVSPSIYEAICTPGMDAWHFGTPTAISDIAPFREHEQVWGIRSAYFDPMNPQNIADTIHSYLSNDAKLKEDGQISKENISKYTWDITAKGYLKVFEKAVNTK